jgi:hypothetical protein
VLQVDSTGYQGKVRKTALVETNDALLTKFFVAIEAWVKPKNAETSQPTPKTKPGG